MLTILISGMVQGQNFEFDCFDVDEYQAEDGSLYTTDPRGLYGVFDNGLLFVANNPAILDNPLADYTFYVRAWASSYQSEDTTSREFLLYVQNGRIVGASTYGVLVYDGGGYVSIYIEGLNQTSVVIVSRGEEPYRKYWQHGEFN